MRVTVVGAGNGGQALAGHCASLGHTVCLYNLHLGKISSIQLNPVIRLQGAVDEEGVVSLITGDIHEAVEFAEIILIVTTATAHSELAEQMLPYLRDGQIIILNPGRTCGVLEFDAVLRRRAHLHVHLAEAQTLMYACRLINPGLVNIIGVKDKVMLSGRNREESLLIIEKVKDIFPCFIPAKNLIQTGLENIGAIFHPSIVLFNAATIERNTTFYFYRDMTPAIASCIVKLDAERLKIGEAYGIELMSVSDWIVYAYPQTWGSSLGERMRNNPAYYNIMGPGSIFTRQLTEDIPTGLLPMSELARIANVHTPLMDSMITLSSALLDTDFRKKGRTLENLGISHLDKEAIIELLS